MLPLKQTQVPPHPPPNVFLQFEKCATMSGLTPIGLRHESLALARNGMLLRTIADRVGVTPTTVIVNRIIQRLATGILQPGQSTGPLRMTTPHPGASLVPDGARGLYEICSYPEF